MPATSTLLNAVLIDPEGGLPQAIGRVEFQDQGQLRLVSAVAEQQALLENMIETMNAKRKIMLDISPPPGARQGSAWGKSYERTSPDYLMATQQHVRKYFQIDLVPLTDAERLYEAPAAAAPALAPEEDPEFGLQPNLVPAQQPDSPDQI